MKQKRVYGWKPSLPDFRDFKYSPAFRATPLSPTLDMRPLQPPIFDQSTLGSCTGNGIASELEAQAMAQKEVTEPFSRLFIYYNEREMEDTVSSDSGANIRDGIQSVATTGACYESDWPYDIEKFADKPTPNCYVDAAKFKALKYEAVTQNLIHIKTALSTGRGLVIGISVYDSFESDTVETTGIVLIPGASESQLGGHCVRLIGYTDKELSDVPANNFIGMNSWGTNWGIKGFFAIPYEYITNPGLCSDLWLISSVS